MDGFNISLTSLAVVADMMNSLFLPNVMSNRSLRMDIVRSSFSAYLHSCNKASEKRPPYGDTFYQENYDR